MAVDTGSFATIGTRIVAGRPFTAGDYRTLDHPVIIDSALRVD